MHSSILPRGVAYLGDIDPTIVQSVRYAGCDNFLGRPVNGYNDKKIILANVTALALREVQNTLKLHNYSLVVYDGYRPQRAVDNFLAWSQDPSDQITKSCYYPTVDKRDVFDLGYVARRSGHTRGGTVDLSLISLSSKVREIIFSTRTLTDGQMVPFLDDGTEDMGTSFDLFHEVSYHNSPLIESDKLEKRNFLKSLMNQHGFKEYSKEWWHYTLLKEPFPDEYFDFVIEQ